MSIWKVILNDGVLRERGYCRRVIGGVGNGDDARTDYLVTPGDPESLLPV